MHKNVHHPSELMIRPSVLFKLMLQIQILLLLISMKLNFTLENCESSVNGKIKSLSIIVFSYIFNLHASSGALLDIVSEVSYMAYGSVVISVNTGCCFYNKYILSNKKLYEMKKAIKSSQYLS